MKICIIWRQKLSPNMNGYGCWIQGVWTIWAFKKYTVFMLDSLRWNTGLQKIKG